MAIVQLQTGQTGQTGDGAGNRDDLDQAAAADLVVTLRRRSAAALEAAYGFLKRQQDIWALLRAEVLCQARPASDLSAALAAAQRADGSFPVLTVVSGGGLGFPPTRFDSLDREAAAIVGSFEALSIAADAKLLHAAWVEATVRFLERRQQSDGAYRLSGMAGISESPREDAALESDVFWTGMVAGMLGRLPVARPEGLEAAGAWLAERFAPEAVEHDGYPALCAYSHFFTNVAHELSDEALQWCGRALEKGFRSRRLEAVAILRVLLLCDAQAMPGARFDVGELLERLLEEQAADGGYAELSPAGPATRTSQTFDAMLALVGLCAALPGSAAASRPD